MTFVKASGTDVPASRSQGELEKVLRRYGATGFGVQSDYAAGTVRVFFRVPDEPGQTATIPVRLEVDIRAVGALLNRGKKRRRYRRWTPSGYVERKPEDDLAQAERVAWRHLVLWVDAALSAAAAGVQKVSEAFLAQTLVRGDNGQVMRVIDQMDAVAGGDWRLRLTAGDKA